MKLESAGVLGRDFLNLKPTISNSILNTTELLVEIFHAKETVAARDLAYSAHAYLAKGLAQLAIEKACTESVDTIGLSGGVAYNQIFTKILRSVVEAAGLRFVVHRAVPPGDGGLSFGQACAAGF
jgi:hydrogenase maturation protein HypF